MKKEIDEPVVLIRWNKRSVIFKCLCFHCPPWKCCIFNTRPFQGISSCLCIQTAPYLSQSNVNEKSVLLRFHMFRAWVLIVSLHACIFIFLDEREAVQKKTFTKWVNAHLQKLSAHVNDLYHDLKDGRKLIMLLEILSGERLVRYSYHLSFHDYLASFDFHTAQELPSHRRCP